MLLKVLLVLFTALEIKVSYNSVLLTSTQKEIDVIVSIASIIVF